MLGARFGSLRGNLGDPELPKRVRSTKSGQNVVLGTSLGRADAPQSMEKPTVVDSFNFSHYLMLQFSLCCLDGKKGQ